MSNISLNSTRLLSQKKIPFTVHEFSDTIRNAEDVAAEIGVSSDHVYKTLVVLKSQPRAKPMLIMLAADKQLDLKKVAKAVGEKKVQMATHQEAERLTGLQVGGISALALLNRGFEIYLDQHARDLTKILVSGGQRGVDLELTVTDLVKVTKARWIEAV
jgi:Cys-tRNA(Pro)/Cys-tRNA(Cys) deacylase